jgi:hypothetical protein
MPESLQELLTDFAPWALLRTSLSFPGEQLVYVVRVVDSDSTPVRIPRARKIDESGIVNIGSGQGARRLGNLQAALALMKREEWQQSKHHQLMLWWVDCDFDSLAGFKDRHLEVTWKCVIDKAAARELESKLLWAYKVEFADLPIGNLKTW